MKSYSELLRGSKVAINEVHKSVFQILNIVNGLRNNDNDTKEWFNGILKSDRKLDLNDLYRLPTGFAITTTENGKTSPVIFSATELENIPSTPENGGFAVCFMSKIVNKETKEKVYYFAPVNTVATFFKSFEQKNDLMVATFKKVLKEQRKAVLADQRKIRALERKDRKQLEATAAKLGCTVEDLLKLKK